MKYILGKDQKSQFIDCAFKWYQSILIKLQNQTAKVRGIVSLHSANVHFNSDSLSPTTLLFVPFQKLRK